MIPVEIENARQKVAHTIPTGAPMTVANDAIEILAAVTDKEIKTCKKKQYINQVFCSLVLFL